MAEELYRIDRTGDIDSWVKNLGALQVERADLKNKISSFPTDPASDTWRIQLLMTERLINVHFDNLYYSSAPDNDTLSIYFQD